MVKTVLLITPGRYGWDDYGTKSKRGEIISDEYRLKPKGVEDARWLGDNINKSGVCPVFVFHTGEEMCAQTANIIAGRVASVRNIPPAIMWNSTNRREAYIGGEKKYAEFERQEKLFWRGLRRGFLDSDGIRLYLYNSQIIPDDVEQIAFVSTPAFGGVFNECRHPKGGRSDPCWTCPIIYKFNVQKQTLESLVPYDGRFGYV